MPKIIKQSPIFKSKLFTINEAQIQFEKKVLNYEIIAGTGKGAVLIIPILDECVLFIKEYAAGVDDYMITLPKGKIDDNEDMYAAANRELQEEVGYKSNNIKFIQKIYLAPGYISHVTNMMTADKLEKSTLVGDEPEALEVHKIQISQINSFLKDYKIIDSRVYAAVNYLETRYGKI